MNNALKKIVVLGPESTGKSTLSEQLANYYQTVWVPEYARTYLEQIDRPYRQEDLLLIAKGQLKWEDEMVKNARRLLICDTDLRVIKIWSEFKYGSCHSWIEQQIKQRSYDHFLLMDIDMPWEYDILREHPDKNTRTILLEIYEANLEKERVPYTLISGDSTSRLHQAVLVIDSYLKP